MTLITCGLDPGQERSAYAVLQPAAPAGAGAYGARLQLLAHGHCATPPDLRHWDLTPLLDTLQQNRPAVVAVEVARGSIATGRAADPVLRNNITAGQLVAFLVAAGYTATVVAAGGQAAGWNWRTALGIKGKGAAARDKSVATILTMRGVLLPKGPRGGQNQDVVDATGLAAAVLDRCSRRTCLTPLDALLVPDAAAAHNLEQQRVGRAQRKAARTVQARYRQ